MPLSSYQPRSRHNRHVPGTRHNFGQCVEDRSSSEPHGRGVDLCRLPATAVRAICVGTLGGSPVPDQCYGAPGGPSGSPQQSQVQFGVGAVLENCAVFAGAAGLLI